MVVRAGSVALLSSILPVLPILLIVYLAYNKQTQHHREMTEWNVERDDKGSVTLYQEHPSGIVQLGDALLFNTCVVLSSNIITPAWNTYPCIYTVEDVPCCIV